MKLVVFSHKPCWPSASSPTGFATDGGFPLQMAALASLFDSTELLVPCMRRQPEGAAGIALTGQCLSVTPLTELRGSGFANKLRFPWWMFRNMRPILKGLCSADAIHAPVPGNVGTVGMLLALAFRKRLFVRYCGNWRKPRTLAERFWTSTMERIGGGRNVMLATGGDGEPPSVANSEVKWIFSSSLSSDFLSNAKPRPSPADVTKVRLVAACRQQRGKGTDKVIAALPSLVSDFPKIELEVVGDGDYLPKLREQAIQMGLSDRVYFRGHVPQPSVLESFRRADLFCFPTASEGFPKVVIEAMATGLPVITTPVSVLPSLMSGGAGVLLKEATPGEIAQAVRDCLVSPHRYEEMSLQATKAVKGFSLERWSRTIEDELTAAWGRLRADG